MSQIVKVEVNGKTIEAEKRAWLLRVLLKAGFDVPSLCNAEALPPYAACRLCLVEVEEKGRRRMVTSCDYPVMTDLKVFLDTEKVLKERRCVFEVLLAQAPASAKLKQYAAKYGVESTSFKIREGACILCGLCERVCREIIGADAIDFAGRGAGRLLTTPYDEENSKCIGCGACAYVCPTDCIEVVDKGMVREIPFIHARHELVPCRVCGKPVTSKAHLEVLRKKKLDEVSITTCEECKKKGYARLVAFQGHM
jgi:bidirectional [NiFe] hydrogenase diaphorase subunit